MDDEQKKPPPATCSYVMTGSRTGGNVAPTQKRLTRAFITAEQENNEFVKQKLRMRMFSVK